MRTPVGFYAAQLLSQNGTPAIVVGTGNKDEDGYLFYFCKAGDGVADIQLIADLHKSEVAWTSLSMIHHSMMSYRRRRCLPLEESSTYLNPSSMLLHLPICGPTNQMKMSSVFLMTLSSCGRHTWSTLKRRERESETPSARRPESSLMNWERRQRWFTGETVTRNTIHSICDKERVSCVMWWMGLLM